MSNHFLRTGTTQIRDADGSPPRWYGQQFACQNGRRARGCWGADRKQERTWHVVIACLAAAAGLALAGIANTVVSVVAALTLVNEPVQLMQTTSPAGEQTRLQTVIS